MKKILFILSVIALSIGEAKEVVPQECRGNGCGSGWNEPLVPDNINFLGVDFASACDAHDICYSKCIASCKERHNNPDCNQTSEKLKERRYICDDIFQKSMQKSCEEHSDSFFKNISCTTLAQGYHLMVRLAGAGNFQGKEIEDFLNLLATPEGQTLDLKKFETDIMNVVNQQKLIKQDIRIKTEGNNIKTFVGDKQIILQGEQTSVLENRSLPKNFSDIRIKESEQFQK